VQPSSPAVRAAVPASAPAAEAGQIRTVPYAKGQSDVPAQGQHLLDSLAAELAANAKLRLQLVAYASGSGEDTVEARRLSLARAIRMRAYLIGKGVPSVRMNVRALGNRTEGGGPADRVDLVLVER
jgi:outer membrane protein OmpA-like peptidoglycan-associated protein